MKSLARLGSAAALFLFSVQSYAGSYSYGGYTSAPEIDAGMAALGIGLLAGVVALVAERRRRK